MTLLARLKKLRDECQVCIPSHLEAVVTIKPRDLDDVIALVEAAQYLVSMHKQPNVSIDHYRSYDQIEAALEPFLKTRGEDDKD